MTDLARRERFITLMFEERSRQEEKFGAAHDGLPIAEYLVALMEEVGEVARAHQDGTSADVHCELVQVASVCARIFETFP